MPLHYTTYVLPKAISPFDYDVPFVVLASTTVQEIAHIPLITSFHVIENEAMPFVHASALGFPLPVNDDWIRASQQEYDNRAKVVVAREPLPEGRFSDDSPIGEGIVGMPGWVGEILATKIHSAVRDVPVSVGTGAMDVMIDPSAPTNYPAWAHRIMTPQGQEPR